MGRRTTYGITFRWSRGSGNSAPNSVGRPGTMMQRLGENLDRALFALNLPEFRLPAEGIELPTQHFICLVAADFTAASDSEIAGLAEDLLELGASYFVCWGAGCERAHDLIDEVTLLIDPPIPEGSVIMTTWHADEPLEEALFFLLCSAWPDPGFEDFTGCTVAVSVGDEEIAEQIRLALSQPRDFIAGITA